MVIEGTRLCVKYYCLKRSASRVLGQVLSQLSEGGPNLRYPKSLFRERAYISCLLRRPIFIGYLVKDSTYIGSPRTFDTDLHRGSPKLGIS